LEEVLEIHDVVVDATGGSTGTRDIGLLESAIARPRQTFGEVSLYPGLFKKAAALFESVISNHPFVDGNKRTAVVVAIMFLERNSVTFIASNKDVEIFALNAANRSPGIDAIAEWFEAHSEAVE